MTRRLDLTLAAFALALAACSTTADEEPQAPQPLGPVSYGDFEPIWDRLQVEPGLSLSDLLQAWGARAGMMFTSDEATRVRLTSTDVGVLGSTSVAAPDVYPWVGGLLLRNGFVMADLTGTQPALVGIYPIEAMADAPAVEVSPARLADFERLPALVIQTTVRLDSTDVRTVANSLRGVMTSNGQTTVPVGNTNQMILRGSARQVIDMVATLRKIDQDARLDGVSPR